jgi:hypothetical protein
MNNKHQENGAPAGPLIFTVPAYGFVMALYFDWLGRSNRAAPNSCPDLEARTQEHDCACDCHARRAVGLGAYWGEDTKVVKLSGS